MTATLRTTRRSVTAVTTGDRVALTPDIVGRVSYVQKREAWTRLHFRFADGSKESQWFQDNEGVEVVES